MQLFDDFERTDPTPAEEGEDSFSFMNRVAQPFWQRIRAELDQWFAAYPADDATDLRSRFRDPAPAQHFAAWWELYLHELFRRLGFAVEVHPELEGVSGRPDFRVSTNDDRFYVEAATTFSGIVGDEDRHGERESWIKAAINSVTHPNFFVALDFNHVGTERPSDGEITEPLRSWLDGLDPDEVESEGFAVAPELRLRPRDWDIELRAIAVKREARGKPGHRLLGMGPSLSGYVNDIDMIGRTLDRKRRKYGKPKEPFVLALLLMSAFMENHDIEQALLGRMAYQFDPQDFQRGQWVRQRNGFWMRGGEPRNTRLSAVITGTNVMPWTVAKVWPRLWRNPWAARPLEADLGLPEATASERGTVAYSERDDAPASLVGLPDDWPGPEAPFQGT